MAAPRCIDLKEDVLIWLEDLALEGGADHVLHRARGRGRHGLGLQLRLDLADVHVLHELGNLPRDHLAVVDVLFLVASLLLHCDGRQLVHAEHVVNRLLELVHVRIGHVVLALELLRDLLHHGPVLGHDSLQIAVLRREHGPDETLARLHVLIERVAVHWSIQGQHVLVQELGDLLLVSARIPGEFHGVLTEVRHGHLRVPGLLLHEVPVRLPTLHLRNVQEAGQERIRIKNHLRLILRGRARHAVGDRRPHHRLHPLHDAIRGAGAVEGHLLTILEPQQGGEALDAILGGEVLLGCGIELRQFDLLLLKNVRSLLQLRSKLLAMAAPRRVKLDKRVLVILQVLLERRTIEGDDLLGGGILDEKAQRQGEGQDTPRAPRHCRSVRRWAS
mmetsp:Transcript_118747/g.378704  ORF Transcript_118747/g.378704 Transcript_118747/m.378704 type:complete len:389 (+) Transcript_118747:526-1692(+)